MAGKLPLFASAPRCVIEIDGRTVAYAVGLSLNTSVNLQEVRILGEFAVQSIEPVAVLPASGSFQIVRILDSATFANQKESGKALATNLSGNPATAGSEKAQDLVNAFNSGTSAAAGNDFGQAELLKHLDPRTALLSKSFDVKIKLRVPTAAAIATPPAANDSAGIAAALETTEFITIKDCRLTSSSMNIAPNQLLTMSLEFQGLLMVNEARGGIKENYDSTLKDGIS